MGSNVRLIEKDEAKTIIKDMSYAIGQFISEFEMGTPDEVGDFDSDDCIEARYFNKDKEIHVFRNDDELCCREISDTDKEFVDTEYELAKCFRSHGKSIVVREYLDVDEDGQCYVTGSRLVEVKEA